MPRRKIFHESDGTICTSDRICDDNVREAQKTAGHSKQNIKAKMIIQVHDELVLEVTKEEAGAVSQLLKTTMENAAKLAVPLTVDVHQGTNWAEAK